MKYKTNNEIKEGFPIVSLLPIGTIEELKRLCVKNNWQFTAGKPLLEKINLPEEENFKFYDRLMKKNQTL
jgi:hypothetical protein